MDVVRAAIAGSHNADPAQIAMHLLRELAELPIDASVLLRGPIEGHPGPIETMTEGLCEALSIPVEWCRPEPGGGREATFFRDMLMVEKADIVIAYFHPERIMDGGTGHVVDYAMQTETPVRAFAPEDEAGPTWVGGNEGMVESGGGPSYRNPA